MAVSYYKLDENTSDIPSLTGESTVNRGYFGVPGTLESFIIHYDLAVVGMTDVNSDAGALIKRFRLIIDGQVIHDWSANYDITPGTQAPSPTGYWINSIGGRSLTVPAARDATSMKAWLSIPCGVVITNPTPRFEIQMTLTDGNTFLDDASNLDGSKVSYWARFNTATRVQTRTLPQTSFSHTANSRENVTVRLNPAALPGGTVAGVLACSDAALDNLGSDGYQILSLSPFGQPIDFLRWANGDLDNGISFTTTSAAGEGSLDGATPQSYRAGISGAVFIPTYGLAVSGNGGSLRIITDNGANDDTRFYSPILTAPISATEAPPEIQTQTAVSNTAAAIAARTE